MEQSALKAFIARLDKKIVREVIAQVRRKPAAEDIKWAKTRRKLFNELTAK